MSWPYIPARFPPTGEAARCGTPKTPEPMNQGNDHEARTPSAPRPRLKLKRRNVPQSFCNPPTQDFLASVAAADTPIPSIEEPNIVPNDLERADTIGLMASLDHPYAQDRDLLSLPCYEEFSMPKTPAPADIELLSIRRYPDWSAGSSFSSSTEDDDEDSSPEPDYASSRPSTSRSTYTSSSIFSRMSSFSDDQCISPEGDFPKSIRYANDMLPLAQNPVGNGQAAHPQRHRAPWTKEMDSHLWATFMIYLQDPKVTPFRAGRSCVPPHGVCTRVAREAKRSWRGSKATKKVNGATAAAVAGTATSRLQSGSLTPTADSTGAYIAWPHTCAATRSHLKELCRLKAAAPAHAGPGFRYMSRSPTPLTHTAARHWNRRSTPGRTSFATKEMGLSLAVSTSEVMQPHGPLAQLTSSVETPEMTPTEPDPTQMSQRLLGSIFDPVQPRDAAPTRGRLGSPFIPKSYGPSSSFALASDAMEAEDSRQPHTVGPRRTLQSPPRISRTSMARRRTMISGKPPRDLHHSRKRGSLGNDFWTEPNRSAGVGASQDEPFSRGRVRGKSFLQAALAQYQPPGAAAAEYSSTTSKIRDELFIPRYTGSLESSLNTTSPPKQQHMRLATSTTAPDLSRVASTEAPPRLGSPIPLKTSATSMSFPNRIFTANSAYDGAEGSRNRRFKTFQQPSSQAAENAAMRTPTGRHGRMPVAIVATPEPSSANKLSRRLSYIDERLKELRSGDNGNSHQGAPPSQ